jgi:hypothetical protein
MNEVNRMPSMNRTLGRVSRGRRWVALVIALAATAVSACEPDPVGGAVCPHVDPLCDAMSGLQPQLNPNCNPILSDYKQTTWQSPPIAASTLEPPDIPQGKTIGGRFDFGAGSHETGAVTSWLDAGQDFELEFELVLSAAFSDPGSVLATIIIDGLAVPVQSEGALDGNDGSENVVTHFELHPGGRVHGVFRIPAPELQLGAHSASVLFSTGDRQASLSHSFTMLVQSVRFANRPAPVDLAVTSVPPNTNTIVERQGTSLSLFTTPPDADGTLPLTLLVTPDWSGSCGELTHRSLIVTLLDGMQIPLGDFGLRPAFEQHEGQAAQFDVSITDLPMDGKQHVLEIWHIGNDGAYEEAPHDEYSPWSRFSSQLGSVMWGEP